VLRPGAVPCPDRSAGGRHDDVALAADVPVTTPYQLSQPTAAAGDSNTAPSDKTGLWGLLGLLGLAGLVKHKDANATSNR